MAITSYDIGEGHFHSTEELVKQFPDYNWEREGNVLHVTYKGKPVFDVKETKKRGVLDRINPKYLGPLEDFNLLHKKLFDLLEALVSPP